jgi:hypothetical protein
LQLGSAPDGRVDVANHQFVCRVTMSESLAAQLLRVASEWEARAKSERAGLLQASDRANETNARLTRELEDCRKRADAATSRAERATAALDKSAAVLDRELCASRMLLHVLSDGLARLLRADKGAENEDPAAAAGGGADGSLLALAVQVRDATAPASPTSLCGAAAAGDEGKLAVWLRPASALLAAGAADPPAAGDLSQHPRLMAALNAALMSACAGGSVPCINALLAAGADATARTTDDGLMTSPLLAAAEGET